MGIIFRFCCIVARICRADKECEKDDEYYHFPFHPLFLHVHVFAFYMRAINPNNPTMTR